MADPSAFSISYGSLTIGGSTGLILHGPYTISRSNAQITVGATFIVTASSHEGLASQCLQVEGDLSKRDQNLVIRLGSSTMTYTHGTSILNSRATVSKSGDEMTDRGFSRAYSVTIEGDLPATDQQGLRDLRVSIQHAASGQRTVTMSGTYTGEGGTKASARYAAAFDSRAQTVLSGLSGGGTYELVSESVESDRNDHLAQFSRTYVELLANQSTSLDDEDIADHRISMQLTSNHPGDGIEEIARMRRASLTYSCSVKKGKEAGQLWRSKIRSRMLSEFRSEFSPQVFAVEQEDVEVEPTTNKMTARLVVLFQPQGGSKIVEAMLDVEYRESRHIDYTPVHGKGEFQAFADPGWATRERIWNRVVMAVGDQAPNKRVGENASGELVKPWTDRLGDDTGPDARHDGSVKADGWNLVSNQSRVTPMFVGDAELGEQVRYTILHETIVERWHQKVEGGGGPITPGGGGQ
jgi:hypothetical protein